MSKIPPPRAVCSMTLRINMAHLLTATDQLLCTLPRSATAKLHTMDELREIERSIEIDAPPEDVWERLVDGDLAEEWLGVEIGPRPGGPASVPEEDMIGTVEEIEPGLWITGEWRQRHGGPYPVVITI